MPLLQQHMMAIRIQQRFWYTRCRWITTRRIANKLLALGLDFSRPALFICALTSKEMKQLLVLWLRRIGASHIPVNTILNAFSIGMFNYMCVYSQSENANALVAASEQFARLLDQRLRISRPVEGFTAAMDTFIRIYTVWTSANEANIRRELLQRAVMYTLQLLSHRNVIDDRTEHAARMSLFIGGFDKYTELFQTSPEIKAVNLSSSSRFWGQCDMSIPRLLHEFLMDKHFVFSREHVMSAFTSSYEITSIRSFFLDLRAVLLFPQVDAKILTDMAGMMDFETALPENIPAFAARLIPLIAETVIRDRVVSDQIIDAWRVCPRDSTHSILQCLKKSARDMRFALTNAELIQYRQKLYRPPFGLYRPDLCINKHAEFKHTEDWLLRQLTGYPMLRRVAEGDPFALVRFLDHSVMHYALEGNFNEPVPEIMIFDLDRMKGIFSHPRNHHIRLIEMADAQVVPEDVVVRDTVETLRKIAFVSRFQHGARLVGMIRILAKRIIGDPVSV